MYMQDRYRIKINKTLGTKEKEYHKKTGKISWEDMLNPETSKPQNLGSCYSLRNRKVIKGSYFEGYR